MAAPGSAGAAADPVERTLNVYLAQSVTEGAQLYLLQSPLRPPSRPYALAEADAVRFKVRPRRACRLVTRSLSLHAAAAVGAALGAQS